MFGLGMGELLIILVIVLVIFGATRLPMIGKGLGEGIRNLRVPSRSAARAERPRVASDPLLVAPRR